MNVYAWYSIFFFIGKQRRCELVIEVSILGGFVQVVLRTGDRIHRLPCFEAQEVTCGVNHWFH
jgi:hypothetical protein